VQRTAARRLVNACDRFHRIDVLINNAGFVERAPLCASI
jgi:NADP-dependent 3-hydroxy acid dehydrogenase YdfG